MRVIIMEGVLFVAMLAAGGALLYWVLMFTPVGVKIRQTQNRKRLERSAALVCPIHGRRAEDQLVRLSNGEQACPDCYKETLHG
jgi:hypothetical protein